MLTALDLEVIEKKHYIIRHKWRKTGIIPRAVVQVIFTCKDNSIIFRDVIIEGDDYLQWSSVLHYKFFIKLYSA